MTPTQASMIKGMLARGDKQHDIAATFGLDSARVAEVKNGTRHPEVAAAVDARLPPRANRTAIGLLIDDTLDIARQVEILNELIATTPPDSPSVVLTITPELAKIILETRNGNNRKKRANKIKRFALYMADHQWPLTGDTLKFGATSISEAGVVIGGDLLDGQNRLAACLLSGEPFQTHCVFGIDPVAFKVLDSGAVRTSGDTFTVAGVPNPAVAAAATRWLMIFNDPKLSRSSTIANPDLFAYYVGHTNKDRLQQQIQRAKKVRRTIPVGSLTALLYLFTRKDPDMAKIFAHDLEKGVRSAKVLLAEFDRIRSTTGSRVHENHCISLVIMCWNAYRTDVPLRTKAQLKWTDGTAYPTIA
jgi:hypothetical protein